MRPAGTGAAGLTPGGVKDSGATARPEPYAVALLRGGPRAAVTVAELAPRPRGVADAGRPGTVRVSGEPGGAGQTLPALREPMGVRQLAALPDVRRAPGELRDELARRPVTQASTPPDPRRATRAPRPVRRTTAPRDREGLSADAIAMAVAPHGEPALSD
ncbi:hypothetical protein [Streptomyces lincolnensis]|uniref:hypothetical protein n=1 Tax=Streptomyces lincolnensis TaxID=1915 RepID=UPI0037D88321